MVVYLDLVFLLNFIADFFALYVTARLSGLLLQKKRLIAASLLGGTYGVISMIPNVSSAGSFFFQIMIAALMIWHVFGIQKIFLRLVLLFFVLSCSIGGVMFAFVEHSSLYGFSSALLNLNWKVFFLSGGLCYFLLAVVFRGGVRHEVAGDIVRGTITRNKKAVSLDILLDTGHTLCDPVTGGPVLTVWQNTLKQLWSMEENDILLHLESRGAAWCAEKLGDLAPGQFWLVPYCSVGVSTGILLCFRAEQVIINGGNLGSLSIAVSPTTVSDGGRYSALWGGRMKMEGRIE